MSKLRSRISHFFIPSQNNNYRAKLLHLDILLSLILVVSVYIIGIHGLSAARILGIATNITIEKLYELTNQKRAENGLSPLQYNQQLATAAQNKARDMFEKNYWAHYAQDGTTPWSFILSTGYQYEIAGENLAHGFLFSENVVNEWMKSETHRQNLLKSDYQDIGFAVVNGTLQGDPTTLVVQFFGKSSSQTKEQELQTNIAQAKEPEQETPETKQLAQTKGRSEQKENKNLAAGPVIGRAGLDVRAASYNSSLLIIGFLVFALIIDLIYAYRLRILRVNSKNIAHIIFLAVIIISVLFLTKGAIL